MATGSAPGKIILFGEHAVVYGRPAIAVPVHEVLAQATLFPLEEGKPGHITLEAPDIGLSTSLDAIEEGHPIRRCIQLSMAALEIKDPAPFRIEIASSIPISSGMGSSAAISVALIRALSNHFAKGLSRDHQSKIAFEVEKIYHGTPSGIDNTVIAFEKPVFFRRGEDPQAINPGEAMSFLIADSGISSPTAQVVEGVRQRWLEDEDYYEAIFDQISDLTILARRAILSGQIAVLGPLMNQNHTLLKAIGVSAPEVDRIVRGSLDSGALGAKLSGAGKGGNIISLIEPSLVGGISNAMLDAGAKRIYTTSVVP